LRFWNDRDGDGGECVADSYADSHTYADGHTCGDGHTYADSHTDGHTCGDGHTYTDSHTDGHTYADSHTDAYGHTYADSHTDANGHTDAVHRKMFTDAEAGSDSGAASHATRSDSCHVHERHAWGSDGCSS
jgi:hypothetical protein